MVGLLGLYKEILSHIHQKGGRERARGFSLSFVSSTAFWIWKVHPLVWPLTQQSLGCCSHRTVCERLAEKSCKSVTPRYMPKPFRVRRDTYIGVSHRWRWTAMAGDGPVKVVCHGSINEACRRDVKEWSQTPESSTKQPCLWEVQKPTKPIAGVQRLNGGRRPGGNHGCWQCPRPDFNAVQPASCSSAPCVFVYRCLFFRLLI